MADFVVDENMPRSTAQVLRGAGHNAVDVRDAGLRGADDGVVFAFAQSSRAILLTADRDFSSILTFSPGSHAGIIVVRMPNPMPNDVVNREILRALGEIQVSDLPGSLVIVEPGRTRVRRANPEQLSDADLSRARQLE
jgi:predicted nuclease of predicted toxin-antitoxin system